METSVFEDNAKTFKSIKAEREFEARAERMLSGHRLPPNGRNFLAWVMRFRPQDKYIANFDNTFNEAPGSTHRLNKEFCPTCDKRKGWCECLRCIDPNTGKGAMKE